MIDYQAYFDRLAPVRGAWRAANQYFYDELEGFISYIVPTGRRVLEIGSGTGDLLARLAPRQGVGLEISERLTALAREQHTDARLEFTTQPLEQLTGEFDYVVVSDVVGYVADIEEFFIALRPRLHRRSRLVITQYNRLWEPVLNLASWLRLRMPMIEQNWLNRSDIEGFLKLADYEVVTRGGKILLPIYIPILSWLCNRYLANLPLLNRLTLVNYFVARPVNWGPLPDEPSLTIVVPARNEAGTIERIANELPALGAWTEVIFIEGNSTDNTREVIERVVANYQGPNRLRWGVQDGKGKGDAVRKGFAMATGDIVTIYDADMTVPAADMPKFYRALVQGHGEFINGSRLIYPLEQESMQTLNYIGNHFFGRAFSWILGQRIKDSLCGTKLLWRDDYQAIVANRGFFGEFDPFGDFDLLFGAAKLNLKIIDVPIRYKERIYGSTNIQRWRHGWLLIKMVVFALNKIKFV